MGFCSFPWIASVVFSPSSRPADDHDGSQSRKIEASNSARLAPLFAGLGCPLSLLLEIPVLTEHLSITHNSAYKSPTLSAGLIISLVLGFLANVSLICRYFEYRPQLSTLSAIGHLTLHDVLNVIILVFFAIKKHRSAFSFPQAGWMLVASSAFSILCNTTLIIDYIRVDNFRANGSGLTTKQRTLVIVTMCLLLYIGFGAMVFTMIEPDRIKFNDALYFCVCTVTTVGFGDVTPSTTGARVFNFFYAIAGICTLAVVISITRDTIFEVFEAFYASRRQIFSERARERRENRAMAKDRLQGMELGLSEVSVMEYSTPNSPPSTNYPPGQSRWSSFWSQIRLDRRKRNPGSSVDYHSSMVSGNPAEAYKVFKRRLLREEEKEFQTKMICAGSLFACFWLLGGVVFKFTEGWTYGEALYFGYAAFLTLGYGDYSVRTPGGRAFFIAWSIIGIGNMTFLLAVLTQAWEIRYKRAIGKSRQRKLGLNKLDRTLFPAVGEERKHGEYSVYEKEFEKLYEIPNLLVEAAKEFSKHARFWMNGGAGDPPAGLIDMMKETENLEGVERIKDPGELVENVMSGKRRQKLFLISFAKTFDILTQRASETTAIIKERTEDFKRLNMLIENSQSDTECKTAQDGMLEGGSKSHPSSETLQDGLDVANVVDPKQILSVTDSLVAQWPSRQHSIIGLSRSGTSQSGRLEDFLMDRSPQFKSSANPVRILSLDSKADGLLDPIARCSGTQRKSSHHDANDLNTTTLCHNLASRRLSRLNSCDGDRPLRLVAGSPSEQVQNLTMSFDTKNQSRSISRDCRQSRSVSQNRRQSIQGVIELEVGAGNQSEAVKCRRLKKLGNPWRQSM